MQDSSDPEGINFLVRSLVVLGGSMLAMVIGWVLRLAGKFSPVQYVLGFFGASTCASFFVFSALFSQLVVPYWVTFGPLLGVLAGALLCFKARRHDIA